MTDQDIDPQAAQPAALHIISHIGWEREGSESFETRRARLLDQVAALAEQMNAEPRLHLLLGGQTVLLEDIAAVRPDLLTLLVIYNAGGRLGIGPWYVLVDEALVSGEALLRNLLMGRADAARYGLNILPVAYLPEGSGHTSQLPQILRGFGLDAAFLRHGAHVVHLPFRWQGPDGSTILVLDHETPLDDAARDLLDQIAQSAQGQQAAGPDAPLLWMSDAAAAPADLIARLQARLDIPVMRSSLPVYIKALRGRTPDEERPVVQGELRLQGLRANSYLLPGMLSARMPLKQSHARLQNRLIYGAEPWTALALTHGQVAHPENLQALLQYSWRLLLQNQARATLGGAVSDRVYRSAAIRAQQCEDASEQVIQNALRALVGTPQKAHTPATAQQETCVLVWNPHNWPVQQVIEIPLRLPVGLYPAAVIDPDGDEIVCGWRAPEGEADERPGDHSGWISFIASAPPVGYAAYRVRLSDQPEFTAPQRSAGSRIIGVPDQLTLAVNEGRLSAQVSEPPLVAADGQLLQPGTTRMLIQDLLRFCDGGDAGDIYNYSPPEPDVIVEADLAPDVQVEAAALYQRLIMRHRLRVAPALKPDRSRTRGVKLIELTTTATLYDYMPGIYFHTMFENTVQDHRLRAYLRTGIDSDSVLADAAYDVVARRVDLPGQDAGPLRPDMEALTAAYPMQTFCAAQDTASGIALAARGLPEFEPVREDGQITLALTLLRAVGWLSRGDLRTRTASVGPLLAVPGAQCQEVISAEYALRPFAPNDPGLLRWGREYSAPLQVYQADAPPVERQRSYLNIEGDHLLLTALKPPQNGQGWIVRLLNPTSQTIEARLKPEGALSSAALVNLAEEQPQRVEIEGGTVSVVVEPHRIVTLRLEFERS